MALTVIGCEMNWHDVFEYRDGDLIWRKPSNYKPFLAGKPAGSVSGGHLNVVVAQKKFKVHRIVWEMHNGPIPKGMQIDHVNRNGHDNRIENLRLANHSENCRNSRKRPGTISRFKGVYYHRASGLYHAKIHVNNRVISLGYHRTDVEGAVAYNAAAIKYHGEFACLNEVSSGRQ